MAERGASSSVHPNGGKTTYAGAHVATQLGWADLQNLAEDRYSERCPKLGSDGTVFDWLNQRNPMDEIGSQSLVDLFERSCARRGDAPLFGVRDGDAFRWLSYAEVHARVARMRMLLRCLGVVPGDRIAIIANNSVDWAVLCYATFGCGAVLVPMYTAQHVDDWQHILLDSGARFVFLEGRNVRSAFECIRPSLPKLVRAIAIDGPIEDPDSMSSRLAALGDDLVEAPLSPNPNAPACFIYTSGTTGRPKGVILSHSNIVFDVVAAVRSFPITEADRTVSFLPWAHAFGQTVDLHLMIYVGCQVAINADVSVLLTNLSLAQPTVLVAVPRVFNRIHEVVRQQISRNRSAIRRLFNRGVKAASRRAHGERLSLVDRGWLAAADRIVFRRVRARFGGRLRFVICGSAALNQEVGEFVNAMGIEFFEGYGLTEASPVVAVNTFEHRRFGTVGRPLPGVKVTIDKSIGPDPSQGEILVGGPTVMQGYHGLPEETSRTITPDGRLRTGDLGYLDADGYLVVTGRIKEQYKLSNGKYVAPTPIEEKLKESPLVANCMLYGADETYCVLIVAPNRTNLEQHAKDSGISITDLESQPEVRSLLRQELAKLAAGFAPYARPKKLLVVSEDFTIENGLLTPSQKVRRNAVIEKYQTHLRKLYADSARDPRPYVPGESRTDASRQTAEC
jgi:long-chain acyl-CoA synthetase